MRPQGGIRYFLKPQGILNPGRLQIRRHPRANYLSGYFF